MGNITLRIKLNNNKTIKTMKKLITATTAIIIGLSVTLISLSAESKGIVTNETEATSSYCEGFDDGHCEGFRDVMGRYAICPIPPICPIPDIDCSRGYRCGYNRGFKQGMRDAYDEL